MSSAPSTSLVQVLVVAAAVLWSHPGPHARVPDRGGMVVSGGTLRRVASSLVAKAGGSVPVDTASWSVRSCVQWVRSHPVLSSMAFATVVVVGPVAAVGWAVVPLSGWWRGRRRAHRREQAIVDELPDVVDLLRLAVASGCTVQLAVEAVVRHGRGSVPRQLAVVLARVSRGARLSEALAASRSQTEPLIPVLDALIAADRYGTPLVPVLVRLGDDARGARRSRAEAAARRVPVQLLFPLVACILPAIGFLTVIPVARSALDGMDLGI